MKRPKKPVIFQSVSICTVVSFGTSSKCALKIALAHTTGSGVVLTTVGVGKKGGTSFTPNRLLKKMFELNGHSVTVVNMDVGNNQMEKLNEL